MKQTSILPHLAAAAIVTILSALVYASVQQTYRSLANDPQLQVAGDISNKLEHGGSIDKWINDDTIDISESLSVFTALYNDKGEPTAATELLNGKMPFLPKGVFDFAREKEENVFTWQPEKNVRVAMVLRSLHSPAYSFVAVGRSLAKVEKREMSLMWTVFVGWLLCMGVIMLHWIIAFIKTRTSYK